MVLYNGLQLSHKKQSEIMPLFQRGQDNSVEDPSPLLENKLKVYLLFQCYCIDFKLLIHLNRQY